MGRHQQQYRLQQDQGIATYWVVMLDVLYQLNVVLKQVMVKCYSNPC